jgi:hypothetical protein
MPTFIRAQAVGFAGEVNAIAIDAFNDSEILSAVKNGSGNLELIAWRCAPTDTEVTQVSDSGSQAGSVSRVTIAAIEYSNVVTAVRNGSSNLELIGWSVASNGTLTRWGDSGSQAGSVSEISITAMDGPGPTNDVLTTVRDGSGNLLMISWRPDPGSGTIERLPDGAAGTASDLSSCFTVTDSGPKYIVAMRNGSDNPELIAFDVVGAGASSGFVRTGDYSGDGEATATAMIDLCARSSCARYARFRERTS